MTDALIRSRGGMAGVPPVAGGTARIRRHPRRRVHDAPSADPAIDVRRESADGPGHRVDGRAAGLAGGGADRDRAGDRPGGGALRRRLVGVVARGTGRRVRGVGHLLPVGVPTGDPGDAGGLLPVAPEGGAGRPRSSPRDSRAAGRRLEHLHDGCQSPGSGTGAAGVPVRRRRRHRHRGDRPVRDQLAARRVRPARNADDDVAAGPGGRAGASADVHPAPARRRRHRLGRRSGGRAARRSRASAPSRRRPTATAR